MKLNFTQKNLAVLKTVVPLQRSSYLMADEPACMQQAFFMSRCKQYTVPYPRVIL
jgi:hypothetical protein